MPEQLTAPAGNGPTLDELDAQLAELLLFVVFSWRTRSYDGSQAAGTLLREHLSWMLTLEAEGRLLAAGPLNPAFRFFDDEGAGTDAGSASVVPPAAGSPLAGPGTAVAAKRGLAAASGMYVIGAESLSQARAIAAQDPFIQAGWRCCEVYPWLLNQGVSRHAASAVADRFGCHRK